MGWKGAAPGTIPANRYKEINQKKLLPDHSGMLVPKEDLFDEIYVGQLMEGTQGQAFKYFGKYKLV